MNDFDFSPLKFGAVQHTAYEITDVSRECEPPYLMYAAGLIGQRDLETAINVAYFSHMSVGRALVMHGIVRQTSLDLAIDLSYLLRSNRVRRGKAIDLLRFERRFIGSLSDKDADAGQETRGLQEFEPPLVPLRNPLMKALQGAYSKNSVFYSV